MSKPNDPVERHYDDLADHWDRFTQGPWKRQVLWPAVQSLLPDVTGTRVLDVGCGNGHYTAWLAEEGANATGIDVSDEMVRNAREEYGDSAEFHRADITESLTFLDDAEFDIILCQHVFSHIPNLDPVVAEFARVLRHGGSLVLSTHHPFHDFRVVEREKYPRTADIEGVTAEPVVEPARDNAHYHDTERFEIHWGGQESENPGVYHRRPLSKLLQPILAKGFELCELTEPTPTQEFEREYPNHVESVRRRPPRALCLRAERS